MTRRVISQFQHHMAMKRNRHMKFDFFQAVSLLEFTVAFSFLKSEHSYLVLGSV